VREKDCQSSNLALSLIDYIVYHPCILTSEGALPYLGRSPPMIYQFLVLSETLTFACSVFMAAFVLSYSCRHGTPLLSGACKATKHHSMSHTCLQIVIFLFHILYEYNQKVILAWVKVQSSYSAVPVPVWLANHPASNACKEHSVEFTAHCTTQAG